MPSVEQQEEAKQALATMFIVVCILAGFGLLVRQWWHRSEQQETLKTTSSSISLQDDTPLNTPDSVSEQNSRTNSRGSSADLGQRTSMLGLSGLFSLKRRGGMHSGIELSQVYASASLYEVESAMLILRSVDYDLNALQAYEMSMKR